MTQLGDEEAWVRDCIRVALPGSIIEQYDDGSQDSMYDLVITYPDGRAGAVEVTTAADAQQLELWKLVSRRGQPWIDPTLTGGWIVEILSSAKVKGLSRHLPDLLRDLERDGLKTVRGNKVSTNRPSALAGQLGVTQATQGGTDRPGSIYFVPAQSLGGYSPITGDSLAEWLGEWVVDPSRTDNLGKLARSGKPEHHLFVLVPGFNLAPFAVNDLLIAPDAPLPAIPPTLPSEVTHLWTMSTWNTGDGFRWSPEAGWTRFAKVAPH